MSVHHVKAATAAAFVAACFAATAARADDAVATTDAAKGSDLDAAVQSTIFRGDPVSNLYDDVQKWKKDEGIPISVGAWHWWHMNRNRPRDFQYGIPSLQGTYYYYLTFDPDMSNGDMKMGLHIDARFRDGDDRFRPFFESRAWLWEAYAWGEMCGATVKAGKIWRRFGLDWDGSWYGNVPYFDGWKLDPDWGVAAEGTSEIHGVKTPWFLQGFFAEDKVNGSEPGADAESDPRAREKLSVVARAVPTWDLHENGKVELGLSWQAGQIDERNGGIHSVTAEAVDLTWSKGPVKAFGEIMKSVGQRNATNYVTAGPSDRSEDWLVGGAYQWQFVTFRATVSHGHYSNPIGSQIFYLLGATVAVTKNVDFYVEWVRWDTHAAGAAHHQNFEDGINFILNWRF